MLSSFRRARTRGSLCRPQPRHCSLSRRFRPSKKSILLTASSKWSNPLNGTISKSNLNYQTANRTRYLKLTILEIFNWSSSPPVTNTRRVPQNCLIKLNFSSLSLRGITRIWARSTPIRRSVNCLSCLLSASQRKTILCRRTTRSVSDRDIKVTREISLAAVWWRLSNSRSIPHWTTSKHNES